MRSLIALVGLLLAQVALAQASDCAADRVRLQILGTRGPEFIDGGASTGYLLWLDGRARVIVDMGPGTAQTFAKTGADFNDIELVAFTHFHVDHSAAFPAFIKASYFTQRSRSLRVVGPSGAAGFTPSADQFVAGLFAANDGVFPYLGDLALPDAGEGYGVSTTTVPWSDADPKLSEVHREPLLRVLAAPVRHGPIPALAYRVEMAGCVVTFTGDMSGRLETIVELARGADILVAHNAIPETAIGVAARLHMKPSFIGRVAREAGVHRLLLTHLMKRTLPSRDETLRLIRAEYAGTVEFPQELDIIRPESSTASALP